jgi:hypothetical protein
LYGKLHSDKGIHQGQQGSIKHGGKMSENNKGNGKSIWITLWIFAVIIFPTLFFIGNNVIANEQRSIQRDEDLKQCIHNYIIPMKEAIARIEIRIESVVTK